MVSFVRVSELLLGVFVSGGLLDGSLSSSFVFSWVSGLLLGILVSGGLSGGFLGSLLISGWRSMTHGDGPSGGIGAEVDCWGLFLSLALFEVVCWTGFLHIHGGLGLLLSVPCVGLLVIHDGLGLKLGL